jgi:hypothetical protein
MPDYRYFISIRLTCLPLASSVEDEWLPDVSIRQFLFLATSHWLCDPAGGFSRAKLC